MTQNSATHKQLADVFGRLEVVDAKKPLRAFPIPDDFNGANQLDPHTCGFARFCARAIGATAAMIFKKISYIDHVCEDGVRRINRYQNSRPVEKVVAAFDLGKDFDINMPFDFLPPSKSHRLDVQKVKARRWARTPHGTLLKREWTARNRLTSATADLEKLQARLEQLCARYAPDAKSVVETKAQIATLKDKLKVLRENFDAAHKAAISARQEPFGKVETKGRVRNLNIRNHMGAMSKFRKKPLVEVAA